MQWWQDFVSFIIIWQRGRWSESSLLKLQSEVNVPCCKKYVCLPTPTERLQAFFRWIVKWIHFWCKNDIIILKATRKLRRLRHIAIIIFRLSFTKKVRPSSVLSDTCHIKRGKKRKKRFILSDVQTDRQHHFEFSGGKNSISLSLSLYSFSLSVCSSVHAPNNSNQKYRYIKNNQKQAIIVFEFLPIIHVPCEHKIFILTWETVNYFEPKQHAYQLQAWYPYRQTKRLNRSWTRPTAVELTLPAWRSSSPTITSAFGSKMFIHCPKKFYRINLQLWNWRMRVILKLTLILRIVLPEKKGIKC